MEKINLPFFYQLGDTLRSLAEIKTEATKREILIASILLKQPLDTLLSTFSGLTICRASGYKLLQTIDAAWEKEDVASNWDTPAEYDLTRITTQAKEFETVLLAELENLATYHAEQKGIYNTNNLIDRAEKVLPNSILRKITDQVVDEIRQAGRCLAFDIPTASGFHIMRATEAVLHQYYLEICKPTNTKPLDNWGAYISELYKMNDSDVKEVLAILQQIKDRHRNLIMHPEVVLTHDEAFTLFEIAKSAIMAMSTRLPDNPVVLPAPTLAPAIV